MHEGSRGLGWGEVLEWVSNRRELPLWPAFDFATLGVKAADDIAGLGISGHQKGASDSVRPGSPVKIDPDIAEEYRDHFLQQSKKTKNGCQTVGFRAVPTNRGNASTRGRR